MSTDQPSSSAGPEPERASRSVRALAGLTQFLAGYRFPVLVASLVLGVALLIVLVLVVPDDAGVFGAFARDFKMWCFSYDPATGEMPTGLVLMMLSELVLFAAFVVLVWWRPLTRARRATPGGLVRWSLGGVAGAFVLGVALMTMSASQAAPAGVAELRTAAEAPELVLVDHRAEPVRLADLRGKVVMVTAVYATCGYTCPMLLGQATRAREALTPAERADLVVLAITLDPEHDTPGVLAEMAHARGLNDPAWHLLSGEPDSVERTLDEWAFARRRNPETGQIDHANVFVLIDREGRQAFRLALSEEREPWLADALRILLAESRVAARGR